MPFSLISNVIQNFIQPTQPLSWKMAFLLAALLGGVHVLAFAPFSFWPAQWLSLAGLFILFIKQSHAPTLNKKKIFFLGLSYGFVFFYGGIYWLTIAMSKYGGMPWVLSALALSLLVLYMASFIGVALLLGHDIQKRAQAQTHVVLLVILPSSFSVMELARAYLFTGFPWLSMGYAHTASLLSGYAPIIGVYGLTWLSCLCVGTLTSLIYLQSRTSIYLNLAGILTILLIGIGSQQIEWTQAYGKPIHTRLVQGNIEQSLKFRPDMVASTLLQYQSKIFEKPADLIVLPETAMPVLSHHLPPDYLPSIRQFAQANHSHIAIGVAMQKNENQYTNSLLVIAPNHQASDLHSNATHNINAPTQADYPQADYLYDKHHLVPFGEFIPTGFAWFVQLMNIPLGEFSTKGLYQTPFSVGQLNIMPNICYEDLFGNEIAEQIRFNEKAQPHILLNVSNMAWYDNATAMPQHQQLSQMRALEMARPMIRSTNTGATAYINEKGQVLAALPFEKQGTLDVQVQGRSGFTPYIRWGNGVIVCILLLQLGWAMIFVIRNANRSNSPNTTLRT